MYGLLSLMHVRLQILGFFHSIAGQQHVRQTKAMCYASYVSLICDLLNFVEPTDDAIPA